MGKAFIAADERLPCFERTHLGVVIRLPQLEKAFIAADERLPGCRRAHLTAVICLPQFKNGHSDAFAHLPLLEIGHLGVVIRLPQSGKAQCNAAERFSSCRITLSRNAAMCIFQMASHKKIVQSFVHIMCLNTRFLVESERMC